MIGLVTRASARALPRGSAALVLDVAAAAIESGSDIDR